MGYSVKEYQDEDGCSPYRERLSRLGIATRARIEARVFRFELGNLGDVKMVGDGVREARLDFGPGYRIYFGLNGQTIVLLLVGDKSSQSADIRTAKRYWKDYQAGGEP